MSFTPCNIVINGYFTGQGSVSEVETQLAIACPVQSSGRDLFHGANRLGYVNDTNDMDQQLETVRKLILGLIRYLRARNEKG